jgi:hypothetical protein
MKSKQAKRCRAAHCRRTAYSRSTAHWSRPANRGRTAVTISLQEILEQLVSVL